MQNSNRQECQEITIRSAAADAIMLQQQQKKQQQQQQQLLPSHDQTSHSTLIPTRKHQWCHDNATGIDRIVACIPSSLFLPLHVSRFVILGPSAYVQRALPLLHLSHITHLCYRTSNVTELHCLLNLTWCYIIATGILLFYVY